MVDNHRLSSLPARPPTPPRSSSFLSSKENARPAARHSALPPPSSLPSPRDSSPLPTSDFPSKRVNFSPLASYIKAPDPISSSMKSQAQLRRLRPSSQCKPTKSILKSKPFSPDAIHSDELRSSPSEDLSGMLQSVIMQLSGDSVLCKRDAYMQLLGSLAAYCDQPESGGLLNNINLFIDCIRRDMGSTYSFPNNSDLSLAHQALSLLSMFLVKPELSNRISDEFKFYILDHSISSIQNPTTPKMIVIDYMRILAVQTFSPKILTNGRVTRLLEVLKEESDRAKGKSVVVLRLAIYERLFLQARSVFTTHASLWMDRVIAGLLHKVKDIRTKAIQLGFRMADSLGPNAPISKAVDEVLDLPMENELKFVNELCDRMTKLISIRESGPHVPQIWSIIILFLRKARWSIDRWVHFKRWMLVIQKCFNCSDPATNSQALLAWNRLVYAAQPNERSGKDMTKFLCRPIFSQLERKRDPKRSARIDQAFSSYCNLLYYSFKPAASFQRLDLLWKEYITFPSSQVLNSHSENVQGICRILAALMWCPHPKVWDEKKTTEVTKVEPEDLLRLDCKWVRSRLSTILPVFEYLFKNSAQPGVAIDESPIGVAWVHLARSLADASNKEIQPSIETMEAIASLLEVLQRLWKNGPQSFNQNPDNGSDAFFNSFQFLAKTVMSAMGSLPFTDKMLLKTSLETFRIAQTPTHRRPPTKGTIRSPVLHLLHSISCSPSHSISPRYHALFNGIIEISLSGRTSRGPRLELLRQFAESLLNTAESDLELAVDHAQHIWNGISTIAKETLDSSQSDPITKNKEDSALRDYDRVVQILTIGVKSHILTAEWSQLFESLLTLVRAERGDVAVSNTVENIVDYALRQNLEIPVPHTVTLMKAAIFPSNPVVQQSNNLFNSKRYPTVQPSYENLVSLANRALQELYNKQPDTCIDDKLKLLETTIQWLDKCPSSFGFNLLEHLQTGVAPWVVDSKRQLAAEANADIRVIATARSLVSSIIRVFRTFTDTDSAVLGKLETLISSGFGSHHRSTANSFILMWNDSFGLQEQLVYPAAVEPILKGLQPFVDLQLPSFPQQSDSKAAFQPPEYISSEEDSEPTFSAVKRQNGQHKTGSAASSPAKLSSSSRRDRYRKKKLQHKKNGISTPKSRPRHDDSQIQFVPVELSPTIGTEPESQLLTENQKDVIERQQTEAVAHIFSGLPAPNSTSRRKTVPKSDLINDTSTPTIPAIPAHLEEQVAFSSPTPGCRNQTAQDLDLDLSTFPSSIEWGSSSDAGPPFSPLKSHYSSRDTTSAPPVSNGTDHTPNESQSDRDTGDKSAGPGFTPESPNIENQEQTSNLSSSNLRTFQVSIGETEMAVAGQISRTQTHGLTAKSQEESAASVDSEMIQSPFCDELEQQIASQLEQDLELSMDLKTSDNEQQIGKAKPSTRGKKRKRPDHHGPPDDRAKRRASLTPGASASSEAALDTGKAEVDSLSNISNRSSEKRRGGLRRRKGRLSQSVEIKSKEVDANGTPVLAVDGFKRRSLRLRGRPVGEESEAVDTSIGTQPEEPNMSQETVEDPDIEMSPPEEEAPGTSRDKSSSLANISTPQPCVMINSQPELVTQRNTGASILNSLKSILGSIKLASFGRPVLREIDDVMFDIKVEAHDAVKRHE